MGSSWGFPSLSGNSWVTTDLSMVSYGFNFKILGLAQWNLDLRFLRIGLLIAIVVPIQNQRFGVILGSRIVRNSHIWDTYLYIKYIIFPSIMLTIWVCLKTGYPETWLFGKSSSILGLPYIGGRSSTFRQTNLPSPLFMVKSLLLLVSSLLLMAESTFLIG